MKYLTTLIKEGSFIMPSDEEIEKMDLIDVRRNLMKWCEVSQGSISPCRTCKHRCKAGKWALELYDRTAVPKTDGPEVVKKVSEEKEDEKKDGVENVHVPELTNAGTPVAQWYVDAKASGNPVEYCRKQFGISASKARRKIYMYEYNHFGALKEKLDIERPSKPVPKKAAEIVDEDFSLEKDLVQKKEALIKIQEQYQAQINELNERLAKITNQIDSINMCLELIE